MCQCVFELEKKGRHEKIFQSEPFGQIMRDERDSKGGKWTEKTERPDALGL